LNPQDAAGLSIKSGDVVEVYNDYGSTYALAYLESTIKPSQTFMQFGHFNGVMGNVTTPWTDRNVVPYYKGTWANVRRVGTVDDFKDTVSFKRRHFDTA
jgi:arsenite oxidase large subunit